MTTVADLVDTTRRHLYGSHQGRYNFLNGALTDSVTTLICELSTNVPTAGTIIGVDDELMFVKSAAGQTITVARGWDDTVAAAHSDAAIVEVAPRFPRFAIKQALLEEVRSWPRTLFKRSTATLTGSTTTRSFSLTAGLGTSWLGITEVRYGPTDDDTYPALQQYDIDRRANALYLPANLESGHDLYVTYTAPFTTSTWAAATDVEATVGLAASMVDIPPLGAAWRLLATREVKRTFTEAQSEPRHSEEVPSGASMRAAAGLKALRDQRINEEAERLAPTVTWRF